MDKKPTRVSSCTQEHVDKGMAYINGGYKESGVVPTTDGLAIAMDVCRKTPYNWAEQESNEFREEIAYILDRTQALQGDRIVNGGLSGEMNATVVGKMLANHGFSQSSTIDLSSKDGSMTPAPALDTSKLSTAALKELMAARASADSE